MGKTIKRTDLKDILVIAVSGLGENIMLLPLLESLKSLLPGVRVCLAVRTENAARFMRINSPADEVIACDYGIQDTVRKKLSFIRGLRNRGFDAAINTFPSSRADKMLLLLLSGAKTKITHLPKRAGIAALLALFAGRRIPVDGSLHDIEQNLALLPLLGIDIPRGNPIPYIKPPALTAKRGNPTVGIHPGSSREFGMSKKRWPAENFISLAERLADEKGADISVFIGPCDSDINFRIGDKYKERIRIAGGPAENLPGSIGRCDVFIGNDSAPVHIAAAIGIYTVAIFGPSDPVRTKPRGNKVKVIRSGDIASVSVGEVFEAACQGLR